MTFQEFMGTIIYVLKIPEEMLLSKKIEEISSQQDIMG